MPDGPKLRQDCIVVLDVGKTLAKLTLWSADGRLLDRSTRPNERKLSRRGYPCLDVDGIEAWLAATLASFASRQPIRAIVPAAHGAAAVILRSDGSFVEPLDYEAPLPDALREQYLAERDPFAETGSPALPCGLNLGAQIHWLEAIEPEALRDGIIVTWPQFWAWRLSGVAATEVTSLGTHTDLWRPFEARPSRLAERRGWAKRLAPLRRASDVLGPVAPAIRERCGLPEECSVICGIHDSNADLLAVLARIGSRDLTVLSTGTWFIAMRSSPAMPDISGLAENRDCLVNVNAFGMPVPSARFMGGREAELLEEAAPLDPAEHEQALLHRAADIVGKGVFALPAFQKGVGPYPDHEGRWMGRPEDQLGRRAAAGLYLALMADTSLSLIGARDRLVVEGRFIGDPVFARALASLRTGVLLAPSGNSLCHGAIGLVAPEIVFDTELVEVQPLPFGIASYAKQWRELLAHAGGEG